MSSDCNKEKSHRRPKCVYPKSKGSQDCHFSDGETSHALQRITCTGRSKSVYFRRLIKRRGRILFVGVCDFHWVSGDYLKVLKRAHSFRCLTLVLVLHECNVGTRRDKSDLLQSWKPTNNTIRRHCIIIHNYECTQKFTIFPTSN